MQIIRILKAVALNELQYLFEGIIRAAYNARISLDYVDIVYLSFVGYALVLGDKPLVYALAQVVMSPILAVQIDGNRASSLIYNARTDVSTASRRRVYLPS